MTKLRSSSSVSSSSPPLAWFEDPGFDGPEPMTILDSGRIYGHAALWGTCHVGIQSACVTPPRAVDDYAAFLLGARRTSDGVEVAVGPVTLGTTHAAMHLNADATRRHYEDTGYAVADVAMGDDEWGPWFAGSIRRGVSDERIEELRAAKISGDWRENPQRHLSLVGLLAVNTPGFPVPRPRVRIAASGERETLVASNIVPRSERLLAAVAASQAAYAEAVRTGEIDRLMLRVKMPDLLRRAVR